MSGIYLLLRVAVTLIMAGAGLALALGMLIVAWMFVGWFLQGLAEIWK